MSGEQMIDRVASGREERNGKPSLGQKIRQVRRSRGMTQQALADGIVTVSMISQIESDKAMPSYKVLRALADRLEMPLEYFLSDLASQTRQNALYKLAQGKMAAGEHDQAVAVLRELLEIEDLYIPRWKIQMDLADCYMQGEQWERAEGILEDVLGDLLEREERREAVRCLDRLAQVRLRRGRLSLAVYHWEKACELMAGDAELFGPLFAEVYYHLGIGYARAGQLEQAASSLAKAFYAAQKERNPEETARVSLHLAEVLHAMGDDAKACQYAERAMSLFEHVRHRKLYLDIKSRYAQYYGATGRIQDSLYMLQECADEYQASGQLDEWVRVHLQIALLWYRHGRADEAERACILALERVRPGSDDEAELRCLYAKLLVDRGDVEGAVSQMETAVVIWREAGQVEKLSESYADLVEWYRRRGDYVRAEAALRNGLTTIRRQRKMFLEMG